MIKHQQRASFSSNYFVYPKQNLWGKFVNVIINQHQLKSCFRWIMARAPFVKLKSDVKNVLYLNWVIPLEIAQQLVPNNIEILSRNNKTILSILSYKHGGFAASFLGPLRRFFPSPQQSNWRFYVETIHGKQVIEPTVLFIKNLFDSPLYTIGSRLFSDALPSHLSEKFIQGQSGNKIYSHIAAGKGSSPSYRILCELTSNKDLPEEFSLFYESWDDALQHLIFQESAIAMIDKIPDFAHARLHLDINMHSIQKLNVIQYQAGPLLTFLNATAKPFAFFIPSLGFDILSEDKIYKK